MINHRASPSRSQTSHTTDWEKKNQWCEWVHRASQLRSRITVMTCTYLVVPHHTSSLHFSSASQLSYNSSPLSTFIRQILTQKPFQYKTRGRLPTQRSTASWIQLTLQAISPCLGVAQGFGPDSSHSLGDSQPTSQLRSQAGSLEGAESEVSSKKASYLMKTCLGKSRTRTVCLRCKVHDQTSFLATESTSRSPRPVLSFHSNPIPSNAILMQSSLKHSSSLGLQAALTKQCFPDYTLRPDAAHSQTTLPFSLPTAWQQHTEVWNGWQPAGSAEELDDGHSPRWCWYEMSLVKKRPPIPAQPAVIQKEPTETVSWAPRAFISDFVSSRGCRGLSSLEHVKIDWNAWTKACTVHWLPEQQVSHYGNPLQSRLLLFPWSLGKECVSSRHRNAQSLACTFK